MFQSFKSRVLLTTMPMALSYCRLYLMTTMPTFHTQGSVGLQGSLHINRTNLANGTFQFTSQLSIGRITDDFVNVTCTVTSDPITHDRCGCPQFVCSDISKTSLVNTWYTLCFKWSISIVLSVSLI